MSSTGPSVGIDPQLLHSLADFRYRLRTFLHLSEKAAQSAGLQPQQHQLLLQLAGAPDNTVPTIAWAAERLGLRHNSTVELVDRSVRQGLLRRRADPDDSRRVVLQATPQGRRVLEQLAVYHARELYDLAPDLLRALRRIGRHGRAQQPPRKAKRA